MKFCHLQKWYADLITETGDYVFCYLIFVSLAGYRECEFNLYFASRTEPAKFISFPIHLNYFDDSSGRVTLNAHEGRLEINDKYWKINFHKPQFEVLFYAKNGNADRGQLVPLTILRNRKRFYIEWIPLHLLSEIQGYLKFDNQQYKFNLCRGYLDNVISTVLPFFVLIKQLYWGRLHSNQLNLTYVLALNSKGHQWGQMIYERKGKKKVLPDQKIAVKNWKYSQTLGIDYPLTFQLTANSENEQIRLMVEHQKEAVTSHFVEGRSIPEKIKAKIYRFFARNPRGIKFFSKADVSYSTGKEKINLSKIDLIDEFVLFS